VHIWESICAHVLISSEVNFPKLVPLLVEHEFDIGDEAECNGCILGVAGPPFLSHELDGTVLSNDSLEVNGKDVIEVDGRIQGPQLYLSALESLLPALGWDLARFLMDSLVVIEGDELVEDLLGFRAVRDLVFFAEKGKAPLEVVKDFFDFSFGLGLAFPGIDHADIELLEGPSELDFAFIFTELISDMNALMKDETKDRVIVQVVSERQAVGEEGLPDGLKMLEGGFDGDDSGPDDASAMIIFG